MNFIFRWALKLLIPIGILTGVLFFLAGGIQDTSLEEFTITGISNIDTQGFAFDAQLMLNNPSKLPVPIRDIVYNATLERSETQVASGEIDSFILRPGESTADLTQRIEWVPTVRTAADLLTQDEVWMRIDAVARLDLLFIDEIAIPFSDRVDIREYVLQFAPQGVSDAISQTQDTLDTVTGSQSDSTGNGLLIEETTNSLI